MTVSEPVVLAQEGSLWVVSKPAGYAVHPTHDPSIRDLVSWAKQVHGADGLAPAHRLDRDTSGVVLLSTSSKERGRLGKLFERGEVRKVYLAVVVEAMEGEGVICEPLADARRGRPLEAVTRYRTLETLPDCTLLEVTPETGRKHQIRRHLQGLGHAVVGDTRYRHRRFVRIHAFPGRLWLHALRLTLLDGTTWEAPLAPELVEHLDRLRSIVRLTPDLEVSDGRSVDASAARRPSQAADEAGTGGGQPTRRPEGG